MNKTCARCEKTVYPTEELKCLDKVWHKGCFKCQECGMTLNMRTYKGYGKLPYCESHVPKAKHTTMAETPELKRIAENTKIQSNVKYHADFEKSKGKFTQVADDPETLRIKANTKIISNVAYHGDLEKKAQMEKQRQINENGEIVDVAENYQQQIDNMADMLPPNAPYLPPKNHYQTPSTQYSNSGQMAQHSSQQSWSNQTFHQSEKQQIPSHNHQQIQHNHSHNSHSQASQARNHAVSNQSHPIQNQSHSIQNQSHSIQNQSHPIQNQSHPIQNQSHPIQNQSHPIQNQSHPIQNQSHSVQNQAYRQYQDPYYNANTKKQEEYAYQYADYNQQYGQQKIGRIQDYDPLSDGPRAAPNTQRACSTEVYNSSKRGSHSQPQSQQQSRQIGRVTDLDPLANEVPRANHQPLPLQSQKVYLALYDYVANDSDEVSFAEGDFISNVTSIDEGWMTGQVLRTGHTGMLPANYVTEYTDEYAH